MNKTILSEIENAKKIYPFVLREIRKFGIKISDQQTLHLLNSDSILSKKLQKRTGKEIAIINSYINSYLIRNTGELDDEDFRNLSLEISMPEPKIIENISQEELEEIYEIVKQENYKKNANDAIEWNFFMHFNNYFQAILEINLQYLLDTTV
jgi:hypothetical protein